MNSLHNEALVQVRPAMGQGFPAGALDPDDAVHRPLQINVSRGTGSGPTPLAAFDAALVDAGVANYNLLCLSSVIPPNAVIRHSKPTARSDDFGRRLYVVMSQMRQCEPRRQAHAGIAWIQEGDSGLGLFVELHDENRDRLEHDLHRTLESMRRHRDADFGPVQVAIASTQCLQVPVCALVVAVYACEPW